MPFKEITANEIPRNIIHLIGTDWMLITAGNDAKCNSMTASWGQMGVLWNKNVATVYVRPQRYTREFIDREAYFTLNFFAPNTQRDALHLLGTKSGRDGDKITEAGLSTFNTSQLGAASAPAIAQANLVIVCRKLYQQDMNPDCFVDNAPKDSHYPEKDFHRMYVAEIEHVFIQQE